MAIKIETKIGRFGFDYLRGMRILLVTMLLSFSQWLFAQRDMKLLVVASQTEEAALQKWITWREQTGVEVQTLWTEDVNAFPDAGGDTTSNPGKTSRRSHLRTSY